MFRKLLDDAGEWKVGLTLGRLFWMKCLTGVGKWGKSGEEKQRRRQRAEPIWGWITLWPLENDSTCLPD